MITFDEDGAPVVSASVRLSLAEAHALEQPGALERLREQLGRAIYRGLCDDADRKLCAPRNAGEPEPRGIVGADEGA